MPGGEGAQEQAMPTSYASVRSSKMARAAHGRVSRCAWSSFFHAGTSKSSSSEANARSYWRAYSSSRDGGAPAGGGARVEERGVPRAAAAASTR